MKKVVPKFAGLQAALKGKTPATVAAQAPVVGVRHVSGGQAGDVQQGVQQPNQKSRFRMAAMAIPKFSGNVVDYPEWKNLFQDCVESQYEESAVVMILRTQSLPDSLISLVPRCAPLTTVWEKLDKQFLDPARV